MIAELRRRQPLLTGTALFHLALFLVFTTLIAIDDAQVGGINRWIKPSKFAISIAIYMASLAWYWPIAIASESAKRRAAWFLAGTMYFETILLTLQAARGLRSHFNIATPFDAALFNAMGIAIVTNIGVAALVLKWTFRSPPSVYVWSVRLGLLLFVLFALEGGIMARNLSHAVGVPDGGPGLPFVNWSTEAGDLRIAHFIGMHALQGLPLIAAVTKSLALVCTAAAVWAALAAAVLIQALGGTPLLK